MLTVQKLEWLQPFKNLNTKIDVKVLPATVKNLSGKVWTPSLAKFLYSKGVVTWMCCYSAAKREDIANTDLRVVLLLALLGKTTVRQFRVNSAKLLNSSLWTKCRFLVNAAQDKQEVAFGLQAMWQLLAQRTCLNSSFSESHAVSLSYTDYFDPLTLYIPPAPLVKGTYGRGPGAPHIKILERTLR